jgi:hypothetical protein
MKVTSHISPRIEFSARTALPKRKETDTQSNLPFSRLPDTRRTLEIHSGNCGARFIAFYGTEEDAATEIVDTEKCGLCGADPFKRDHFKDAAIRLIAQSTARGASAISSGSDV